MDNPFTQLEQLLMPSAEAKEKVRELPKVDKRFYDTIFAEVGGGPPEEVKAVGSTFINLIDELGYEKALRRSSAYKGKSEQYRMASEGKLDPYSKKAYERNQKLLQELLDDPNSIGPYTNFENVKAFGDPIENGKWDKSMKSWNYKDIGRQRFYWKGK